MAPEEKNAISHRAVAAAMLTPTLKAWLDGAQGILRFS
jgi:inosine/xanthosine triphosphate pyrophosphatase family protein